MSRKTELDNTYMDIAFSMSKLSRASRRKVGAVLVKDNQIIAEGFNGTPNNLDNSCEYTDSLGNLITKVEVLHAEHNVLCKIARSTSSSIGSTLYVTSSPCAGCAKGIIQCGIVRVVYKDLYATDSGHGLSLLKQSNIIINQL